jgi:hypothetical protein
MVKPGVQTRYNLNGLKPLSTLEEGPAWHFVFDRSLASERPAGPMSTSEEVAGPERKRHHRQRVR